MSASARSRMLGRIRERQGKPVQATPSELEAVRAHLFAHPRSPGPRDEGDALERFRTRAAALASTLDDALSWHDVPARVAAYLAARALPPRAVCWPGLPELDWRAAGLDVEVRGARDGDAVGVTGVCCAVAETGTLVTLTGSHTPASVSLLPETHVALVPTARIVRDMEAAWALIREERGALPRAVTFISGPSRTADIEQTVTLGAHGPYRVHIVLVPDLPQG